MLAKACSAAVNGIDAYPVEVEVHSGFGDTIIVIVGLPDAAVKESRDRVLTALINSGFKFTLGRTTINLAPADVKKEGPSFDLPIAVGMLAASEQMEADQLDNFVMVGELALDGAVRAVKGVLPIALQAQAQGKAGILVPPENAAEAAVVTGLQVIPVRNLREAVGFLEGEVRIPPTKVDITRIFDSQSDDEIDFADVKGQESVKRALEIAAAGGHNVLLLFPNPQFQENPLKTDESSRICEEFAAHEFLDASKSSRQYGSNTGTGIKSHGFCGRPTIMTYLAAARSRNSGLPQVCGPLEWSAGVNP